MAASWTAIDTKFVLNIEQLDVVYVQKVGGPAIRTYIPFVEFKAYPLRITVGLVTVVDRANHAMTFGEFESHRLAQIVGEGGNSALTRYIVSNPGDSGGFAEEFHESLPTRVSPPQPALAVLLWRRLPDKWEWKH